MIACARVSAVCDSLSGLAFSCTRRVPIEGEGHTPDSIAQRINFDDLERLCISPAHFSCFTPSPTQLSHITHPQNTGVDLSAVSCERSEEFSAKSGCTDGNGCVEHCYLVSAA